MTTGLRPKSLTAPATTSPLGPWGTVIVSAALLAVVGSTLGSILLLGVIYAKVSGWSGPLPLWEYLSLRDVAEETALSVAMVYAYRSLPAVHDAVRKQGGVFRVALVLGTLALAATRIISRTGFHQPLLLTISWLLYVVFIAYPIVWTLARRAPDAESNAAPSRLTDREFFKTSLGLFVVVSSIYFMHWVIWSPAAGVINLLALFVIPASAVVLGAGARLVMAGACKALEEEPPEWLLTVIAVIVGWAAVIHYFLFAHPPHSP